MDFRELWPDYETFSLAAYIQVQIDVGNNFNILNHATVRHHQVLPGCHVGISIVMSY